MYISNKAKEFLSGYTGTELLKKYSLHSEGIWHVQGEGDSSNYSNSRPTIGYIKGKLFEVLNWAVCQSEWSTWGAGGSINNVEVKPIEECKDIQTAVDEAQIAINEILISLDPKIRNRVKINNIKVFE